MKTELRPQPHTTVAGAIVIELWWQGEFIGQVVGADGPGIRVLSKHPKVAMELDNMITEVIISAP